jgi:multiple sugar transport system substrate-binding protein
MKKARWRAIRQGEQDMVQDQRFPTPFTRRRLLQYGGSAALGSSLLAACAGTGATTNTNSSLPSITQWYHQYGEDGTKDAVMKYAKDYTKANVKVDWKPGTGDEYPNAVRAALLTANPPDVFENNSLSVDQVNAGLLADLSDLVTPVKSDFNPAALKPFTIGGKVYAIKMINDTSFIYYRKSLFKSAGITAEPATLDELINAAKKLSTGDVKGLYVGQDGGVAALYYTLGWTAGIEFITEDNKINFATDRAAATYKKLYDLNKSGGLLPDAPTYWWSPDPFIQGTCAMQWCGLWAMPQIQKAFGDDFGIFPIPPLDSQTKPAMELGGWAEMASNKGNNLEASKAYIKSLWIDNAKVQTDWSVAYGFHVPPRKSTADTTDKLKTGMAAKAVEYLNQYGHSNTPYWNSAMSTYLTNAVSNIKNGSEPKAELTKAQDLCNTELQKML